MENQRSGWQRLGELFTEAVGGKAPPEHLNAAERALWDAYPDGRWIELDDSQPIRGDVVSELLLGVRDGQPGRVPAVRLRGAHITGQINVAGGEVRCELHLDDCDLAEAPDLSTTKIWALRIKSSRLPGFDGAGLECEGPVSFSESTFRGQLKLVGARLRGGLRMNNTVIDAPHVEWAFAAGGLIVDNGLFARNLTVRGGVRLTGARLTAGAFLEGATLTNDDGVALHGQSMVVDDAMECSLGFTAAGTIGLRGARVNGTLSFDQAVLRAPVRALHLTRLTADEVILTPSEPMEGRINMGYAHIGVLLLDDPSRWPRHIELTGCTYESIRGPVPLRSLIDFVSRARAPFRPQPYEELAAWFGRAGHDDLATKTLLAKQRARRQTLGLGGRLWGQLLDWLVGYGYRPWLAAVWLGVLLTVGTIVFSADPPRQVGLDERRTFNAFTYTLDLLNPLGTLGQRTAWEPAGPTLWFAYGLIAAGWILATALIAGAARVLKRT